MRCCFAYYVHMGTRVISIYLLDVILVNYLLRCHNLIVVFYPTVPFYGAVESDTEPRFELEGPTLPEV